MFWFARRLKSRANSMEILRSSTLAIAEISSHSRGRATRDSTMVWATAASLAKGVAAAVPAAAPSEAKTRANSSSQARCSRSRISRKIASRLSK
ncbi:hypothetical protein HMPREF9336_04085 [Segniliparus rugosus ATCC BAA-974]|uniref:Uncharacterized protein n=1 Tax=Segniliparus rugosus (strain ATCC BAA-974 / DSM 45345 / CCUG 50838 / CIP 108380 / JCM 13579 / CDC 945) TaxID=679197 RepID=U1N5G9_SEGRC|nr:hypothetical protein HMPREF9336_04085 [Segniliparus rugosus ATCC BAA-974]